MLKHKLTIVSSIICATFALTQPAIAAKNTHAVAKSSVTAAKHKDGIYPTYPKINYSKYPNAEQIKRGEYLTKAGDCIACHTNTHGDNVAFSGGLANTTPFGTIYSPNITPDKETGIGNWTDDEFVRAIRQGISPSGSYYFPVLPYMQFNKMTREQVLDIKAYLDVIPAVKKKNRDLDMPIPFRWRFMQLGWRLMFFQFHKGELKNDPTKSAMWNRGRFLVKGPGHCDMCHTPINFIGGPKRQYALTGSFINGFHAPNISSTKLGDKTIQQIENVFLKDRKVSGAPIVLPEMLEVNHDSLSLLKRSDLEAIATYLRTVKSKTPPAPKIPDKLDNAASKKVYDQYCAACHNTGAGGAPMVSNKADWEPRIKKGLNVLYKNAIIGIGGMPARGNCTTCSDKVIQAVVDYMVQTSTGAGASTKVVVKYTRPDTGTARGKTIYNKVCFACHDGGVMNAPIVGDQKAWGPLVKQNMDVLFSRAIKGYKNHPEKGACMTCTSADIQAAVKYMVEESTPTGNYNLW